ncbi:PIN domain-containing protein [Thiorhodospira sibirica]|uniref:PIN domain-containing protein n=1 Tax=Thiorhodospira sibirica TaxID=154347 RepID=UPI000319C857|nr:PIN domain-containing protein [Thiorhodospira sibirica]
MSGKRYFFDTNAIIALLQGHEVLVNLAHQAEFIGISVISRLEFFAFSGLTQEDKVLFDQFVSRVNVTDITMQDPVLLDTISQIRMMGSLKLPDAIIIASAQSVHSVLVTADIQLANFAKTSVFLFKPEKS